jgi:DNA-binding transcriptional MerR regulator
VSDALPELAGLVDALGGRSAILDAELIALVDGVVDFCAMAWVGLLRPPERTTGGYRIYDEAAEERLRFIKGAQRMDLQLADIKELLDIRDRGQCPCGHTRELVRKRLAQVEGEIARLGEVRKLLLDLNRRSLECVDGPAEEWRCSVIDWR